jgi:hypothetical protein
MTHVDDKIRENTLIVKPVHKRPLGRLKHRGKDENKLHLKAI